MDSVPNLRHLWAAVEIARRGSISKAAASVHLSQSAVTQGLATLEALAGEPLFDRTGAGLSPTEAGQRFVARAERALQKLRAIDDGNDSADIAPRVLHGVEPLHRQVTSTQLRALVAVVENSGFSLAARELGLSQPSVHRAARELEKLCGRPLFRRRGSGVEATPAARQLARYASLAFAEIRQGFEEVDEMHGRMQSRLVVGSLPLARTELVPDAISRLLELHPSARVKVADGSYDELLHALLNGRIDLIVGALRRPSPSRQLTQEALFDDALSIVVRREHPLLRRGTPAVDELAQLGWIVPREGTPARDHFNAYFSARGIEPPAMCIECSSLVATRGLLMKSDRAALLSVRQAKVDIESGQLAVLTGPLPGTERPIGLTYRKDWRPTAVQAAFVDALRQASRV
ncbi:MAG TPA: LysR family transcriptional regulator [Woeseiaceae bacterium]|nr:LysR family transcriptional regulator [Woeseiaceae bacterium]